MAGNEVGNRRATTLVRHVNAVGPRRHPEQGDRQMIRGARPGRGKRHLVRSLLQIGDQFLDVFGRHARIDDEDVRRTHGDGHQVKILGRIVGEILLQERIDRPDPDRGAEQRVPVRRRALDLRCADGPGGARFVFDDDRLSELFGHFGRHHARQRVGRAPRRERHNDGYRLIRIRSLCARCHKKPCQQGQYGFFHVDPLLRNDALRTTF